MRKHKHKCGRRMPATFHTCQLFMNVAITRAVLKEVKEDQPGLVQTCLHVGEDSSDHSPRLDDITHMGFLHAGSEVELLGVGTATGRRCRIRRRIRP